MKAAGWALAAALSAGLAGCIIVPLSRQESPETRQNIGADVPPFIAAGKTTRADILLALGEPDGTSENGLRFIYTRGVRTGGIFVAMCGYVTCEGGSFEKMSYDRLIILFDDANVVSSARHEQTSCSEAPGTKQAGPCASLAGRDLVVSVPYGASNGESFAGATWYRGIRLGTFQDYPRNGVAGSLVVGGSSLVFYSADADEKSVPLAVIPYAELSGIETVRNILSTARGVIVTRANGGYDTFAMGVKLSGETDSASNERAGKLAQERWRAATGVK